MATFTRAGPQPPGSALTRLAKRHPLAASFALAFALTWALVLPMTFSENLGVGLLPYVLPDPVGIALFVLASFIGPGAAAVIVTALGEGRAGVGRLLRPIARWRVGPQWYAVALLANLAVWLLAYSLVLGPGLLGALIEQSGAALPQDGLAGWLIGDRWINAVAYGIMALLIVAMTRGRLGATRAEHEAQESEAA